MLKNRRLWLAVLLAWLCVYHAMVVYAVIDEGLHGQAKPGLPLDFGFRMQLISGMTREAYDAGVRSLDVLKTVDGKPFSNMRVFFEAVNSRKPGDLLPVTVRSAKGTQFAANIRIPPSETEPPAPLEWFGQLALTIGLPLFCLSLGFWVAFLRPNDRLAWLLLAMLICFGGLGQGFPVDQFPGQLLFCAWWVLFASLYGLCMIWMLLFAFLFPVPFRLDHRLPWLKWILTIPLFLNAVGMTLFEVGREISFQGIAFLRPFLQWELRLRPDLLFPMGAMAIFVLLIGMKSVTTKTIDVRRRLRILLLGSVLSFSPLLLQGVRSVIRGSDLLSDLEPLEAFAILLPLLLFPLTLTYVMVIRRAMDVPSTLRQGIQYVLAQRGLTILQVVVTAVVIAAIALLSARKDWSLAGRIEIIAAGFAVILLLRPAAQWLAHWMDRRLFREAYNNEQILNELTLSLRTLMQENTLIQTLTQKIAAALHVPRISFLVNGGGQFAPAYSTGAQDAAIVLPETSGVVRHLKLSPKAAPIDFDDEKNWIQSIHPADRETLHASHTEVILPVSVKDKLLGVLTLGPKQSAAPYTRRDLQLLDAVATQAGFALENSRLAHQAAQEMAAREVQERLLPQNFPPIPGVDYFGACRPATACGGDYYDFFPLPDGTLCIAIGARGQVMQAGRYATFFYAQYNTQTRELEYVNAGHRPPIVLRKNGNGRSEVIRLETGGPAVGLLPKAAYLQDRVQLQPDDLLVAFTNGISEAMNSAHEEWGEERMLAVLEQCGDCGAAAVAKAVMAAADAFTVGAPQLVDRTVLTMRVLPPPSY